MNKIIKFLSVLSAVIIARLLPFNHIIGSEFGMFSWSSVLAPVIAAQCGLSWVLSFLFSKSLFTATSISLFFLHRLPLFVASQAFVRRSIVTSLLVPLLCMILFIVHPVGSQAWLYAMYWFMPMGLFIAQDSQWSRALTASFTAHGVGSVVYLYTGSISVDIWVALIPLVACERLLMSGAMVVLHQSYMYLVQLFQKRMKRSTYRKVA